MKNKLNQKEEALAEIVDEIVYFENTLKESESNSLELQECLSTNNKSHCEAIQTLIDYANLLEANCDQPETIRSAKAKTSRILNDIVLKIQRSEQNLDPSLDRMLADKVLSGEIPLPIRTWVTQSQVVNGADFNITMTRGVSRLATEVVTYATTHT